jgi:predicted amidohydrolase
LALLVQAALWSAAPRLGAVDANVARVAAALGGGADIVVFPELFLTGYNIGDDVQRLALRDDDPRLGPLTDAARDHAAHLIVGAPHSPRAGVVYNGALCVDGTGRATWVHKRALPTFTTFREGLFFAHGGEQPVWRTRLGPIGVHICYDLYFPEFQKRQVLDGADLLVNISASPSSSRRFFETLLPARAVENACFVAYSNNVGSQDGLVFWGGSQAFGPRGQPLGVLPPFAEGCLDVDIDLSDVAAAREFRPTIRDSDPEDLRLEV